MAEQRNNQKPQEQPNALQEKKPTVSERFMVEVTRQFEAEAGSGVEFTDYERTLAQHLYLCVDAQLKELETKRNDANKPEISMANVNMRKLALDAVHRVQLGLDGLVKGHIYPIPYLNGRTNLYDLDLRIGYRGKDYYRRNCAVDKPIDIRYELVYSNDTFSVKKKDIRNEVESYEFAIVNPFDRGDIIGGFAYLVFADATRNEVVLVSRKDFDKSRAAAKASDFWTKYPVEMCYKTLVHRATDHLQVDPKKVNAAAYAYVEAQDSDAEARADRIAGANANGEPMMIDGNFADEEPPAKPALAPSKQQPAPAAADEGPGF